MAWWRGMAVAAGLSLMAGSSIAAVPSWGDSVEKDPMTDKVTVIYSKPSVARDGTLFLSCARGGDEARPGEVQVTFIVDAYLGPASRTTADYRFDGGVMVTERARQGDHMILGPDKPDVFIARMAKAKVLLARFRPSYGAAVTLEFDLDGVTAVLDELKARCAVA